MNLKVVFIACLAICLAGCAKYAPSSNFSTSAYSLRQARDYWISHGRPSGFQPSEAVGPAYKFFIYSNIVGTTSGTLHCCFGTREIGWPSGVLAITDNGKVIFIRQRDGKVILSPEENGVEY